MSMTAMDFLSHGLWTNVLYLKVSRRERWWAVVFALLPDLVSFGPFFLEEFATHGIGRRPPAFTPSQFAYVWGSYQLTHSLVVFAAVFALVFTIRRGRPWWPLCAWGVHILTDIFTHTRAFFPTPFLWPIADTTVSVIAWANPWFFFPNLIVLTIVYTVIGSRFLHRRRRII